MHHRSHLLTAFHTGPDRGSDYGIGYPHTMTAEWEDASRKMQKFQKANAITEFINERENHH